MKAHFLFGDGSMTDADFTLTGESKLLENVMTGEISTQVEATYCDDSGIYRPAWHPVGSLAGADDEARAFLARVRLGSLK